VVNGLAVGGALALTEVLGGGGATVTAVEVASVTSKGRTGWFCCEAWARRRRRHGDETGCSPKGRHRVGVGCVRGGAAVMGWAGGLGSVTLAGRAGGRGGTAVMGGLVVGVLSP
jgi:hypothetical protein